MFIFHNRQKADIIQRSISGWTDKYDILILYSGTLFDHKKERNRKEIPVSSITWMNPENMLK